MSKKYSCPHCGGEINPAAMLGAGLSEKKLAACKENAKKAGRHKIISTTGFECNAMKEGVMYVLMIVPNRKFVKDGIVTKEVFENYRLVICPANGEQYDAEYQPVPGEFPNLEELAEKNGFETISLRDFARRMKK